MTVTVVGVCLAVFAASVVTTTWVRRVAIARGVIDRPNPRSSHEVPTPRGGGMAIALTTVAGASLVAAVSPVLTAAEAWMVGGALGCASIGLLDDLWSLPPAVKLMGQLAVSLTVLPMLAASGAAPSPLIAAVAVFWTVTYVNQFNFMDGSDGLAAGSAGASAAAVAGMALHAGDDGLALTCAMVAMATLGFLWHNWPPASIFMGDSGSHLLGFVLAAATARLVQDGVAPVIALAPLAPIVVDSTLTLARRAARGERVWEAHRSHLYQRLLAAGWSKPRVARLYLWWSGLSSAIALAGAWLEAPVWAVSMIVVLAQVVAMIAMLRLVIQAERRPHHPAREGRATARVAGDHR